MLKLIFCCVFCCFTSYSGAQDHNKEASIEIDSFFQPSENFNKKRGVYNSVGVASAWTGSMIGLHQVWYKQVEKSSWNTFDDSKSWLQMDKAGHFYTSYKLNALTTDLYRWSGMQTKYATWLGITVSIGFQTTLEFFDAHTQDWGWSWTDFSTNIFGASSYAAQIHFWNEERFIPKFSYSPTPFAEIRPSVLGRTFSERLLKDYNGQTYWLSFSPGSFFKNKRIPEWACVSIGYSAHEKLVGSASYFTDPETGQDYFEQREILISLDIDFSKISVKRPWIRTFLQQLNHLKVPFPTLLFRNGNVLLKPLYF